MPILNDNFTFIDLFAGIGGFRLAMKRYSENSRCLFSSEINEHAAEIYKLNFNEKPLGDIRKIDPIELNIPAPEVVCGGFPCQTFSKGGNQAGFKDSRGTLFREIIRIINCYEHQQKPKILILENVANLITHDDGDTWTVIKREITEAGYNVINKPIVAAPKDFGIPQLRNRAIILAVRNDIYNGEIILDLPKAKPNTTSIQTIIDAEINDEEREKYTLRESELKILNCWQDFLEIIPREDRVIGFPIWSDEFGATYDISDKKKFPKWKQEIITKNRNLFLKYQQQMQQWLDRWDIRNKFTSTHRKFEWQAGTHINSIFDGIIQFRTSGIRVKRPTESPTLVAMDHRPIYGPSKRYLTPKEAARLQSFPDNYRFEESEREIFKQLGNAVNVTVIYSIFREFINFLNERVA